MGEHQTTHRLPSQPNAFQAPPDRLPTFAQRPSWLNRSGRIDRSACLEIRASELWRQVEPSHWRRAGAPNAATAQADVVITAEQLYNLHRARDEFALMGDLRTPKSNALRHPHEADAEARRRHPTGRAWRALRASAEVPPYDSPNRGQFRTKLLGLLGPADPPDAAHPEPAPPHRVSGWSQAITIQRSERRGAKAQGQPRDPRCANPMPPRLQHWIICPACHRRVLKMFMVMAFEQEVVDAYHVEDWLRATSPASHSISDSPFHIASLPGGLPPGDPTSASGDSPIAASNEGNASHRAALIARYGLLFTDRRLLCRHCLGGPENAGIRYGEVRRERRSQRRCGW